MRSKAKHLAMESVSVRYADGSPRWSQDRESGSADGELKTLPKQLWLTVLTESGSERYSVLVPDFSACFAGAAVRRFAARIPEILSPGTCVKLEFGDLLYLGEVIGSTKQDGSIFGIFELRESLTGAAALARRWEAWVELESGSYSRSRRSAAASALPA